MLPKGPNSKNPNSQQPKEQTAFEKLIAEENAEKAQQDKLMKGKTKKDKPTKAILFTAMGVVGALLVTGLVLYDPFAGTWRFGDSPQEKTEVVKEGEGGQVPIASDRTDEWWNNEEDYYPVDLKEWQKTKYEADKASELAQEARGLGIPGMVTSGASLPSEEAGFTSDIDQAMVDELNNPLFSYWTAELWNGEVSLMLERLVNPRVGNWEAAQYSSGAFDPASVMDLFTDDWLNNAGQDRTNYPLYIDWSDNNYGLGDKLLASGSRWFGQVTNVMTTFTYNPEIGQYDVALVADIRYTAWAQDQTKIEKVGVMTLDLVANPGNLYSSSDKRVLINGATLEVK